MTDNKRKYEEAGSGSEDEILVEPSIKKSRFKPSSEARVDPTYGQRSAIPGLDDENTMAGDDWLDYEDGMEALTYLRAVRLVLLPSPKSEIVLRC